VGVQDDPLVDVDREEEDEGDTEVGARTAVIASHRKTFGVFCVMKRSRPSPVLWGRRYRNSVVSRSRTPFAASSR